MQDPLAYRRTRSNCLKITFFRTLFGHASKNSKWFSVELGSRQEEGKVFAFFPSKRKKNTRKRYAKSSQKCGFLGLSCCSKIPFNRAAFDRVNKNSECVLMDLGIGRRTGKFHFCTKKSRYWQFAGNPTLLDIGLRSSVGMGRSRICVQELTAPAPPVRPLPASPVLPFGTIPPVRNQ